MKVSGGSRAWIRSDCAYPGVASLSLQEKNLGVMGMATASLLGTAGSKCDTASRKPPRSPEQPLMADGRKG
ncbi:hypothetical protein [Paenibacillus nasutitermitis]|uniref:Uncharacterized protein n=1 Tax=Paenibacillus nasutitermitis TaxID=1652958 RepID=A0A917E0N6_9BACL|nr:hypothetical protein [Paenibacillus nasutitermitis]GGD86085.1 hypothetical protein GCM10010911_50590 [Paenibacillus nasutitermitis]